MGPMSTEDPISYPDIRFLQTLLIYVHLRINAKTIIAYIHFILCW